ncbi:hypothetical protein ACFY84_30020 [Streptomyces sp. NPDC012438]|uniref:hypothetical protein n=1 Tax=Streptomyces sp. NPDC012438 TaxID=3364833 RepID=UPI0036E5EEAB
MSPYVPFLAGEILTAAKLNSRLMEETMEWTPLSSLGTFATGFSAAPYTPSMRKLRVLGRERWEWMGRITVVSGTIVANTNTTGFTFNAPHRPTFEHGWQLTGGSTGLHGIRATISPGGLFQFGLPTGAGNTTNSILLDGLYADAPL